MLGRITQASHEHAHGEAYAAYHADACEGCPSGAFGLLYDAQLDEEPCCAEHSNELADQQTQEHSQAHTAEEAGDAHSCQVDTCIGKGEQGNDEVVDRVLQRVLKVLQGAYQVVTGALHTLEHVYFIIAEYHRLVAVGDGGLRSGELCQVVSYASDIVLGAQRQVGRDAEGQHHSGYGSVYAAVEHAVPQGQSNGHVE